MTADDFARAESVGVTDILTMPWAYYHGFTDDLALKVEGLERFAVDVMAQIPDAPERLRPDNRQ